MMPCRAICCLRMRVCTISIPQQTVGSFAAQRIRALRTLWQTSGDGYYEQIQFLLQPRFLPLFVAPLLPERVCVLGPCELEPVL
jgi:hypothetical protein